MLTHVRKKYATEEVAYMMYFMEYTVHAWKEEYIIVDYVGKCNVNYHYDLIEPDKK